MMYTVSNESKMSINLKIGTPVKEYKLEPETGSCEVNEKTLALMSSYIKAFGLVVAPMDDDDASSKTHARQRGGTPSDTQYSHTDLNAMVKAQLQEVCEGAGLSPEGTKKELIERIEATQG